MLTPLLAFRKFRPSRNQFLAPTKATGARDRAAPLRGSIRGATHVRGDSSSFSARRRSPAKHNKCGRHLLGEPRRRHVRDPAPIPTAAGHRSSGARRAVGISEPPADQRLRAAASKAAAEAAPKTTSERLMSLSATRSRGRVSQLETFGGFWREDAAGQFKSAPDKRRTASGSLSGGAQRRRRRNENETEPGAAELNEPRTWPTQGRRLARVRGRSACGRAVSMAAISQRIRRVCRGDAAERVSRRIHQPKLKPSRAGQVSLVFWRRPPCRPHWIAARVVVSAPDNQSSPGARQSCFVCARLRRRCAISSPIDDDSAPSPSSSSSLPLPLLLMNAMWFPPRLRQQHSFHDDDDDDRGDEEGSSDAFSAAPI